MSKAIVPYVRPLTPMEFIRAEVEKPNIYALPVEIISHIFSYLKFQDLERACLVCRQWCRIIDLSGGKHMPGDPAEFELKIEWNEVRTSSIFALVRSLVLHSKTKSSFFQKVKFLGYRDGSIVIHVVCQTKKYELAEKYFRYNGVLGFFDPVLYFAKSMSNKLNLFNLLTKNNSFPKDKIELMRTLATTPDWYAITPLKDGKRLPP